MENVPNRAAPNTKYPLFQPISKAPHHPPQQLCIIHPQPTQPASIHPPHPHQSQRPLPRSQHPPPPTRNATPPIPYTPQVPHAITTLGACHCCGMVHQIPPIDPRSVACCTRCNAIIRNGAHPRAVSRAAALALAALILYPLALYLPVMQIQRLGHESHASIWSGMVTLLAERHLFVGLAVLLFSIVAPIAKLALIFTLCISQGRIADHQRARAYRLIELIGRWGMVDVLLVAILVAVVKLGDLVVVTPGPGVALFGAVVILSLLASAAFDPHAIWQRAPQRAPHGQ